MLTFIKCNIIIKKKLFYLIDFYAVSNMDCEIYIFHFCLQYSYFALRGYASVVSLLSVVDTRIINFHKMTYHPLGNIILNINKNFDAYAKGIQDTKI